MAKALHSYIIDTQGQLTLVFSKNKFIKAVIVVLDTCKNDDDPTKIESTCVPTTLLPL